MSISPVISVVLPVYNAEKYLKEAINSLLEQTFSNIEIICINDGSTDSSLGILEEYKQNDNRIKVFSKVNEGILSKTLNFGLKKVSSSAKYIARMDADDICDKQRLSKQFNYMEAHLNIDILGTGVKIIGTNAEYYFAESPTLCDMIFYQYDLKHPTVMFRKEFLDKNKVLYNENTIVDDKELWLRSMCVYGANIANLLEPLVFYRVIDSSLSNEKTKKKAILYELEIHKKKYLNHLHKIDFDRYITLINEYKNRLLIEIKRPKRRYITYSLLTFITFGIFNKYKRKKDLNKKIYLDIRKKLNKYCAFIGSCYNE